MPTAAPTAAGARGRSATISHAKSSIAIGDVAMTIEAMLV
jgi:hypothetical protein